MTRPVIWDFWAKGYERLWVQKYSLQPTMREVIKYLKVHIHQGKKYRILDIGCGTGQLLREIQVELAGNELELLGIDYSQKMISAAKEYEQMIAAVKKRDRGIAYQQLDVRNLQSIEGTFDIVICTHSFPYYQNQAEAIQQMQKLLHPDGTLLLAQASQNSLYDRFVMFFVKLTTGKARYLSVKRVMKITEEYFHCEDIILIKEKPYMPSIYMFALKKRFKC